MNGVKEPMDQDAKFFASGLTDKLHRDRQRAFFRLKRIADHTVDHRAKAFIISGQNLNDFQYIDAALEDGLN